MRPASSLPPGDRLTGIARGAGVERARPTQRQYAAKNSLFLRLRTCCEFLDFRTRRFLFFDGRLDLGLVTGRDWPQEIAFDLTRLPTNRPTE